MKSILFTTLILFSIGAIGQTMIPKGILERVFYLKHGNQKGTCFYLTLDDKDYLVTAKHLFDSTNKSKDYVEIKVLLGDRWNKFQPTLLLHENPDVDIAVLDMHTNTLKYNFFDISDSSFFLTQECFFLGFPFGLRMDDKSSVNNGFPIPFVKKGIVSLFDTDSQGTLRIYLDGHNNKGFSGGPVVIKDLNSENSSKMSIIGVVSAFKKENLQVKSPNDSIVVEGNSGIVLCYGIHHVFEIINGNRIPY